MGSGGGELGEVGRQGGEEGGGESKNGEMGRVWCVMGRGGGERGAA